MSERNEHHYLPVDDRTVEWGFYLTTAGRVLDPVDPGLPYGVHPDMYMFDYNPTPRHPVGARSPRESGRILPEFQVLFMTETHAVFESDETGIVEFHEPTLLFVFPGVWHRYRPVGSEKEWMKTRWFGFNGDIAYRLLDRLAITPETAVLQASRPLQLADAFDRLVDRISTHPATDPILLSVHAMELLARCIESTKHESREKNTVAFEDDLVSRVLELIWTASHRGLTMDQLCESVGAPRRTVERRFRAALGHSLLTEVNHCRLKRAQHFLESTDLPVKNICWLSGFSNPEHMRLIFQQQLGMSPGQYRQNRLTD